MESQWLTLIDRVGRGESEAFGDLLQLLRGRADDPSFLLQLARSSEPVLRRAAVVLSEGHVEDELLQYLATLVEDHDQGVRLQLAHLLQQHAWWPLDLAVARLLADSDGEVRLAAIRAAQYRPVLVPALLERLRSDDSWRARQEIARVLGLMDSPSLVPALLDALASDQDPDVQLECAASLENHLRGLGGYPPELPLPRFALLREAHARVGHFRPGLCPHLAAWLEERVTRDVDLEGLQTFGTLLTLEARSKSLPRAYHFEDAVQALRQVLTSPGPRAAVVLGDVGAGKTALIHELTHRLADPLDEAWHVLRVLPSEFLAGTMYSGEWETKLQKLIQAVRQPRRVILYVPNLEELATVGMSSKTDSNVATALAPFIEKGDIAIVGESTTEAFRSGLGAVRSLRRLFHPIQVPALGLPEIRSVLRAVAGEASVELPERVLERLLDLADFYVAGCAQPGRSVGLLRRVIATLPDRSTPLTERHVLATISSSTGIPVDFLDEAVPMDRSKVRHFFESRVMGQPEAVDAVVDLVTLVKAGLTDPGKPMGVLLFVGPTGVGKTELARSLAEYLFGDPARMIRVDMSEYATHEAYQRLLGHSGSPGVLTAAVAQTPFTVLLLDEIEKAHPNVYDLCLQMFDAGRLTDLQGRTADFRRTIIVLTSNVGASSAQQGGLGFVQARSSPRDGDHTGGLRELKEIFRPEFLNRIDRIVIFRPLSEETAEQIARREVNRVLERGGIARRKMTVDVDPSVLPLLLREGYSQTYGARHLKRTVERVILLPVARAIAGGEAGPGSVLRLVARNNRVEAVVVPPGEAEAAPAPVLPPGVAGLLKEAEHLQTRISVLRDRAAPLSSRKAQVMAILTAPDGYDDRQRAHQLMDEVNRIEGVIDTLARLEKSVNAAHERLSGGRLTERELLRLGELLASLDGLACHAEVLVACRDPRDLGDALLVLSRTTTSRDELGGVGRLAAMYRGLATRHKLDVEVLDDHRIADPPEDVVVLQVTGAGAYALLRNETGLHQLTQGREEGVGRPTLREYVRVEALPLPVVPPRFPPHDLRSEVKPLRDASVRLLRQARFEVSLTHLPSKTTLRGWVDRPRREAITPLLSVLHARLEAAEQHSRDEIVRRYTLGPAPLVRDERSGRRTGRLEEVLAGDLDLFFTPSTSGNVER